MKNKKKDTHKQVKTRKPSPSVRYYIAAVILLIIVVVYVFNEPDKQLTVVKKKQVDMTSQASLGSDSALLVPRKNIFFGLIAEAKSICKKTQDPEALAIVDFLINDARIFLPVAGGVKPLEAPSNSKLSLVVILKDEKLPGARWQGMIAKEYAAAFFDAEIGTIILRESNDSFSVFEQALSLLHEGKHARDFLNQPYDYYNRKLVCFDEVQTHSFQNRLIEKIGGIDYVRELNSQVIVMKDSILASGQKIGDFFPLREEYNPVLDKIYGKNSSTKVKSGGQFHFQIHVAFRLIDKYYAGDKALQKARVMQSVYALVGHMTKGDAF